MEVTETGAEIIGRLAAISVLVGFSYGVHYLVKKWGPYVDPSAAGSGGGLPERRGLTSLWIGKDGRVSTSKLQVVLWTYAVAFGLLSLGVYAIFETVADEKFQLYDDYLILLGSPAAAALIAKASTATKVQAGDIAKTTRTGRVGTQRGLADTVCDDDGQINPFDFQYFLFTVVALVIFLALLLSRTLAEGLPNLPDTLVALTGVSAAGYAAKKSLEREKAVVTGVYPAAASPGERVVVRGKNLVPPSPEAAVVRQDEPERDVGKTRILFGGFEGKNLRKQGKGEFSAGVPLRLKPGETHLSFVRSDGVAAEDHSFRVVKGGPRIISVSQDSIIVGQDKTIIVFGSGFGESGRVTLNDRELNVEGDRNWNENRIRVRLWDTVVEARSADFEVPSKARLVVLDKDERISNEWELTLEDTPSPVS